MKGKAVVWVQVGLLGLVIGLLGVTQFRTQTNILKALQAESPVNQAAAVSNLLEANASLALEVQSLQGQVAKYTSGEDRSGLEALVGDLNRMKVANGLIEVWGPGVEVSVGGEIQPEEAHDTINELRNAGAEAIALNGQRLVASSVVTRGSNGLVVDYTSLERPYMFQAIGDVQTMDVALERKGGIIPLLRFTYPESMILVTRVTRMVLPVYQGTYVFRYAKPAE
ncbi:MAG: DUF881 domain-containing protein [Dehalococcoidia bacterium]|nr:DUF881 domain-containing protein [Dehalococcoidia bacterium]